MGVHSYCMHKHQISSCPSKLLLQWNSAALKWTSLEEKILGLQAQELT